MSTNQTIEHVDAVVVGSGFGGSVSAFRLAEAGRSVVLLERGRAYPPGSFPRTRQQMSRAFWAPSAGLHGMYDVWDFDGLDSVVCSGLGGGSLIYANVLLRKDEKWFVSEQPLPRGGYETWPVSREDLDPHYDVVEKMIGVSPYPLDHEDFKHTPKAHAMQDAAAELGLDWRLPPLAVSFAPGTGAGPGLGLPIAEPAYGNIHGVTRRTCKLCGECDIGCNDGSKNSLDHTYLSAARYHGADIRTLHEVKAIRPREGGGYEVDFVAHSLGGTSPLSVTIRCEKLILGAGTYGTTYLLLRSRASLPGLSAALGSRFSGNGDLMTFALDAKDRNRERVLDASQGPVITCAIRLPDEIDGGDGRGAYIEDGGYPSFVNWMVDMANVPDEMHRVARFVWERFRERIRHGGDTNISKQISDLIGEGSLSMSSLPLLGMGRDVPDGVLKLAGHNRLQVEWHEKNSAVYFDRVRATMKRIAHVLGADYADNPIWFRRRVISVHPLGGAPMGRHEGEGVCDSFGEVFGHPGLYIADGSAMPGAVGANPSLTIAAFANRMADHMLDSSPGSWTRGPKTGDDDMTDDGADEPQGATSLSFTEEMKGHYTGGVSNPRAGELAAGREPFRFRLTIATGDVDRFITERTHTATATGWIEAEGCGGRREVEQGWFNLFVPDGSPDRRLMKYRLHFTDGEGNPRTLAGWKNVFHGPPTDIWPDTSTLFFRVMEGHIQEPEDEHARIIGAGTLHILLTDFAHQLTTFRTEGAHPVRALTRFGRFFAGELWDVYRPEHEHA